MKIMDANIILRFILRDNETLAREAAEIIINNQCLITTDIAAEVVYVLSKVYNISREETAVKVTKVFNLKSIRLSENDVIKHAIKFYGENSLDFADCLLIGYHMVYGYEVCTFDKKLDKLLQKVNPNSDNK